MHVSAQCLIHFVSGECVCPMSVSLPTWVCVGSTTQYGLDKLFLWGAAGCRPFSQHLTSRWFPITFNHIKMPLHKLQGWRQVLRGVVSSLFNMMGVTEAAQLSQYCRGFYSHYFLLSKCTGGSTPSSEKRQHISEFPNSKCNVHPHSLGCSLSVVGGKCCWISRIHFSRIHLYKPIHIAPFTKERLLYFGLTLSQGVY